jgi:hypothetical protein
MRDGPLSLPRPATFLLAPSRLLTVKQKYQVATKGTDLESYKQIVSLYPHAFDRIRFPACMMIVNKGKYLAALAPLPQGLLFLEASDVDPPVIQRFVAKP